MGGRLLVLAGMLAAAAAAATMAGAASLSDQCSKYSTNVAACLNYATGKEAEPAKACCQSAGQIEKSDPVCLCFVIQQTHNGSNSQAKQLGIKVDRLLQLPSACKLNFNISDCTKLLNISPSNPDYNFFTNASATSATPTISTGSSSPATATGGNSAAAKYRPYLAGLVVAAIAIFFCTSPLADAASSFYA